MSTRRQFVRASLAAGGLSLLPDMPAWSRPAETRPIETRFADLMSGLGLASREVGGNIRFQGAEPMFPSATPLATAFAIPAMACAAGAAIAWRMRSGEGQDLQVDIGQAAHGIFPEMTANPTLNGQPYPGLHTDNPIEQSHSYETRDGRFMFVSAVYPHQVREWLNFLGCASTPAAVRAAVGQWKAQELEDEANARKLTTAICRSPEEWRLHPQGALLAATPLVDIRRIGDAPAEPFKPGSRPLSGIRVLSATHAIAGPAVGRTLAEHGAQVLQFNKPDDFEHEWVYLDANVGMGSTYLDLGLPEQNRRARELAASADVFVDNYRGRSIARFGFSPEELAARRPGIVVVTIRCYGWDGPWALRGGFDMLGSATSGLAVLEAVQNRPKLPATLLINDHVAGYLAAAGAIAALIRRAREGGSYHVSVSLTRAAMWYQSLGMMDREALNKSFGEARHRLPPPDMISRSTPFGEITRLAPAIRLSATPASWNDPILVRRGSSKPEWR